MILLPHCITFKLFVEEDSAMLSTLRLILLLPLVILMFSSCSNSEEPEKKSIIEETTDKIAKEAISSIKTPIEQAKLAKELQESHNRAIQETIDQQ